MGQHTADARLVSDSPAAAGGHGPTPDGPAPASHDPARHGSGSPTPDGLAPASCGFGSPALDSSAPAGSSGPRTPGPDVIAVTGLGVCLGGLPVLRDVSLAVGGGQTVALLGGNGSGKTTTLRALLGLIPHQSGSIELFGVPQARFKDWPRFGYVPQKASVSLHATTLAEVVETGTLARPNRKRRRRALVADALDQVGLADRADEIFLHLSGGQQQRALMARALAQTPDVLVLDEPLAGVDLAAQERIRDVLDRFRGAGGAVLAVLHETEVLAGLIDRAVILRGGRVVSDGPLAVGDLPDTGHRHEADPPLAAPGLVTGIETRWNS